MTRVLLVCFTVVIGLATSLLALPPETKSDQGGTALVEDADGFINANNILMFVTNFGEIGRDRDGVFGYDVGTFFPYTTVADIESGSNTTSPLYASGLWLGGLVNGEVRVAVAEYASEYRPGPMSGGIFMADSPEFRLYKIFSSAPNYDWDHWPISQGAPWTYDNDGMTIIPELLGDQMTWAVYNDSDPTKHTLNSGSTDPLGVEVRQTIWAYDAVPPLGNTIFFRFRLYNKGSNLIENCYVSLWADPDLGSATDDLVGCDSTMQFGFCYNADNDDAQYGNSPPAIGYVFLQGPMTVGNSSDTARMWGMNWPGMKDLGMVSFNKYIGGADPSNSQETYNFMQGLLSNGDPYLYEGNQLLYVNSGDPLTGTGDLDIYPADRRFMLSTGPFNFNAGDSTEIYAALVIGDGGDRLTSLLFTKYAASVAQELYDTLYGGDIPTDITDEPTLPARFALHQNYPNPFNPTTVIPFSLTKGTQVQVDIFNVLGQKVRTVTDRFYAAGMHRVEWNGKDNSGSEVASGVYFYRLDSGDQQQTRSMTLIR